MRFPKSLVQIWGHGDGKKTLKTYINMSNRMTSRNIDKTWWYHTSIYAREMEMLGDLNLSVKNAKFSQLSNLSPTSWISLNSFAGTVSKYKDSDLFIPSGSTGEIRHWEQRSSVPVWALRKAQFQQSGMFPARQNCLPNWGRNMDVYDPSTRLTSFDTNRAMHNALHKKKRESL